MKTDFSYTQMQAVATITQDLLSGQVNRGVEQLRALVDETHAAIPDKLRIGRGITWVVERISMLFAAQGLSDEIVHELALTIYNQLEEDDLLIGVPIFLMADYGVRHPLEAFIFFENSAGASHWVVREFTAGAFRKLIRPNKKIVLPWLQKLAQNQDPYRRRFASETLRPVTYNKWLNQQPEYSISVLRLLFKESHPYPRTSVGNNLSDLSRQQPELVFSLVKDLVASGDANSYWIAYRACRNLVKKESEQVMDLLRVNEYHYKDRNFYQKEKEVLSG
jgi:3-methyladenine DNA glycosylase AlkC